MLSLRGLYYSQMVVGPTTLDMQTKGEYKPSIRVGLPSTSHGAATSLGTSTLATRAEENDRVRGGSAELTLVWKAGPKSGGTQQHSEGQPQGRLSMASVLPMNVLH